MEAITAGAIFLKQFVMFVPQMAFAAGLITRLKE